MNPDGVASFVATYGGIYEHSPWVAEQAADVLSESASIEDIARVMADCVDNADRDRQLELIRAHPDLAGKAAVAGELTDASTAEQASAGLDQCEPGTDDFGRQRQRDRVVVLTGRGGTKPFRVNA